jgi:hypothetical protein
VVLGQSPTESSKKPDKNEREGGIIARKIRNTKLIELEFRP